MRGLLNNYKYSLPLSTTMPSACSINTPCVSSLLQHINNHSRDPISIIFLRLFLLVAHMTITVLYSGRGTTKGIFSLESRNPSEDKTTIEVRTDRPLKPWVLL